MSEKGDRVKGLVDELGVALRDLVGEDLPQQFTMTLDVIKQAVDQIELQQEQNKHGDA